MEVDARRSAEEAEAPLGAVTLDSDPAGPIATERAWHLAQLVFHGGVRVNHVPIPIADLRQRIDDKLDRTASAVRARFSTGADHYTREDLVWLRQWLADQVPPGSPNLCRAGPTPDRVPTDGWAWSLYSAQQMLALTSTVLRHAAEGYVDIVTRNFPNAGKALDHIAISPMCIVGEVVTARDERTDSGFETAPVFRYTITKAPAGNSEPIIDITHAFHGDPPRPDFDTAQYDWLAETSLNIGGPRPATQWAYRWLMDDLASVGWAERTPE
jgi:hypothetical protein